MSRSPHSRIQQLQIHECTINLYFVRFFHLLKIVILLHLTWRCGHTCANYRSVRFSILHASIQVVMTSLSFVLVVYNA